MTTADPPVASARGGVEWRRLLNRHGWTVGVWLLLLLVILYWQSVPPVWGTFDVQSLAIDALPLTFAAMAQAVVIISGGIDLSVGSLMALINVLSARFMVESLGDAEVGSFATPVSFEEALAVAAACLVVATLAGALTGLIIVVTRIADIIVTLAMLFIWAGVALIVLETQAGGAPLEYVKLGTGYTLTPWLPTGIVIIAAVVLFVWTPIRWTKPGLAIYAVGSSRNATFLSGINVNRTRIGAYALGGLLAGMGGLALTATAGIGDPLAGDRAGYTLNSVAAVVLGGVSLLGGVGGLIGPIAAAFVLTLVKTILILKGVDQNWAQVIQGTLIVIVVMIGGLAIRQRGKHA
jgi:ribose transport system permease protein